ncbi:L,D-transpeptidase [Nocardia sp. KC 131]|uniref:L,D-transpeptidase n=1 Tax=Nocardia arseniciresistens TaxID=3392119 RepID=UPI00398F4706
MRSILRYLFLATMVSALAAFGSGTAFATSIGTPSAASVAAVTPSAGQVVGIAHPVTIQFTAAVVDRARAERAIDIKSTRSLAGTFAWTNDREVTWTPTGFLPARSPISVRIGSARTEFRTNVGVIADGNMSNHTFTVTVGGGAPRVMPASMGKPGRETPSGTFPILEQFRSIVFDSRTIGIPLNSSEGYLLNGEYAERLTWGGVFVHSAPWSVDSQGYANVSHGCINLSPDDAAWYYEIASIGDPVSMHW